MYKIINHPVGLKFVEFYNQNNFHVTLSNYGASIYRIDMVDKDDNLETITMSPLMVKYYDNDKYFGLTIGRVAGRIVNSTIKVNNETYKLRPNENGNTLHGGPDTLAYKYFNFEIDDKDEYTDVIYSIKINDLEDDLPGNLELRVVYHLYKLFDGFDIKYYAISDRDTPLNITNHTYFNLSGDLKDTIENHTLKVNKEKICKLDKNLIVEGIEGVKAPFDFRKGVSLDSCLNNEKVRKSSIGGLDHIYTGSHPLMIEFYDKKSGRLLLINSNYKDVVMYSNNFARDNIFKNSILDVPFLGLAIEPCRYTNILKENGLTIKAHELYQYKIEYRFKIIKE